MITEAKITDIPTIISIANKAWNTTYRDILSDKQFDYMLAKFYSVENIQKQMQEEFQVYLLYYQEDEVLGFLSYEMNWQDHSICKIHKLYVLPKAQGLGVGKRLIGEVSKIASKNNCNTLSLNVNKYNKALHFYEKLGFENTIPEIIDIGMGYVMDDYVMEKDC